MIMAKEQALLKAQEQFDQMWIWLSRPPETASGSIPWNAT